MRLAGWPRHDPPPPSTAQLSLFPNLPSSVHVQPAIRLTETNVARTVPPGLPGVFFLKSVTPDGQIAERVGRDDVDLRQRLLQFARGALPNVLFGWILAQDANDAYQLECYLWHAHGGAWAGITGDAHPSPSNRIPFLGCPDCDE
jgi:hypothetical protein